MSGKCRCGGLAGLESFMVTKQPQCHAGFALAGVGGFSHPKLAKDLGFEAERALKVSSPNHNGTRTLLVAPGLTTRNKKLLVTKGISASNKDATRSKGIATSNKGHYYYIVAFLAIY